MQKCFDKVMLANGCSAQLPILNEQIRAVTGNYIDSTCGDYNEDSDRCEKLGPPSKIKGSKPKGSRNSHFIRNLVEIFDSIQ